MYCFTLFVLAAINDFVLYFRYRHLVPTDLLQQCYEPVNVKGDGNCLFRSVSMHLYGTEKNWSWVKLRSLEYGLLSLETIFEQVCATIDSLH